MISGLTPTLLALRNRRRGALHRGGVLPVCGSAHHLGRSLDRLRPRTYEEERVKRKMGHGGKQKYFEAQVRFVVRGCCTNRCSAWVARSDGASGQAYLSVYKVKTLASSYFAHFWLAWPMWILKLSASTR